jgi:RNA polymerase sigma-70 factor, ECF subfamily
LKKEGYVVGLQELAARQFSRLYSLARRLIGDEAEDAVQDTLLKTFEPSTY